MDKPRNKQKTILCNLAQLLMGDLATHVLPPYLVDEGIRGLILLFNTCQRFHLLLKSVTLKTVMRAVFPYPLPVESSLELLVKLQLDKESEPDLQKVEFHTWWPVGLFHIQYPETDKLKIELSLQAAILGVFNPFSDTDNESFRFSCGRDCCKAQELSVCIRCSATLEAMQKNGWKTHIDDQGLAVKYYNGLIWEPVAWNRNRMFVYKLGPNHINL
jgi:hypothetical protein